MCSLFPGRRWHLGMSPPYKTDTHGAWVGGGLFYAGTQHLSCTDNFYYFHHHYPRGCAHCFLHAEPRCTQQKGYTRKEYVMCIVDAGYRDPTYTPNATCMITIGKFPAVATDTEHAGITISSQWPSLFMAEKIDFCAHQSMCAIAAPWFWIPANYMIINNCSCTEQKERISPALSGNGSGI